MSTVHYDACPAFCGPLLGLSHLREARTLGCGLCLAMGRLAAMLGPLVFEGKLGLDGPVHTVFAPRIQLRLKGLPNVTS